MANRNFSRHQSLEKGVKSLHIQISTDGSGDVTSFIGKGIESVSHSSDTYSIVLQDAYVRILGASVSPGVQSTHILENVDAANKSLDVTFSDTQVSVDIHIILDLKNSSVGE